jgi:putative hydrolase of the HAD superfamily
VAKSEGDDSSCPLGGPVLKAVLFDFDGSLQDLETAFEVAAEEVLAPFAEAAAVTLTRVKQCLEAIWPGLWREYLRGGITAADLYPQWFSLALGQAGMNEAARQAAAVSHAYQERFEASLRLYPDVLPALDLLRSRRPGLVLAMVTNGPYARQEQRIAALGLHPDSPIRVVSEAVGHSKPDRAIFQHALDRAGVRALESVMVGDDPADDMAGAKQAGLRAVWLNRGGRDWPEDLAPTPDGRAKTLGEAVEQVLALP